MGASGLCCRSSATSRNQETHDDMLVVQKNKETHDDVAVVHKNHETPDGVSTTQDHILRGPKYDIQLPNVSLGKYIFSALLEHGDKIAQVYPGQQEVRLSFRELASRAAGVAAELAERAVGPGDVVALGCRVTPHFTPLLIGVLLRNAIPAPFNPELDQEEVAVVVRETLKPKLVVSEEPALSALGGPDGRLLLALSQVDTDRDPGLALSPEDAAGWLDSCAAILCSSGTTGPPKGVMLSHRGLLTMIVAFRAMMARLPQSTDPRPEAVLSTSPIFWVSGLITQLFALPAGKMACILPSFDEDAVARILGEYNIWSLFMPPNLAVTIAKNSDSPIRKVLDRFKVLSVGGAVMDAETQLFVEKELGVRVSQGYGMTEAVVVAGAQPGVVSPPGSSGKLHFNVEAMVVDVESGSPLGPEQEGELWVRSPCAALGYWNNPQATAEAWDDQGWFHTGDVVRYDQDGFFYVVDRVKQLIKFRGHHVLSPQLENLLQSHPAVKLAAVVGKPHPTDQEHPTAFVVLKPGASVTPEELQRLVDEKVSDHKRLRGGVRIVGELPHTASGKVAKRELRRWAAGQR